MKLSQFISSIDSIKEFTIQLPNGTFVPPHFHVTEMGLLTKNFIDCGNVVREEKVITFQLTAKQTTCLAQDHCGIPADKMEPKVGSWKPKETSCCTTDSGCC